MSGARSKTRSNSPGHSGMKTPSDEVYLQLYEIHAQLEYLGEHRLALVLLDRLDELWETFDAGEKKDLAIAVLNITGG